MVPFIGQIQLWGCNFAPRGFAFCSGQSMPIAQNTALFSLLGTFYGGDSRTTFDLPNMDGRAPMGWGTGPGLTPRRIGEKGGAETIVLSSTQIPSHNHLVGCQTASSNSNLPLSHSPGSSGLGDNEYFAGDPNENMASESIVNQGGGQAHDNMQPWLALNFTIALQGSFPSRS